MTLTSCSDQLRVRDSVATNLTLQVLLGQARMDDLPDQRDVLLVDLGERGLELANLVAELGVDDAELMELGRVGVALGDHAVILLRKLVERRGREPDLERVAHERRRVVRRVGLGIRRRPVLERLAVRLVEARLEELRMSACKRDC